MFSKFLSPAIAAGIAMAAVSAPASAQVNGIAVSNNVVALANSQALLTAYQQVSTTYATQITQLEQLEQQYQAQVRTLDTNGNGTLDEAEVANLDQNNATVQQLSSLEQQINQARNPLDLARIYALSQVAAQYGASAEQVISERNIQVLLSPEAVEWAPDGANVTQQIIDALNTRVPSVSITPPQGWQPTQSLVNLYQQVQQVFAAYRQAQAAAAAQQQQAAPAAGGEVPSR